MTTKNQEKKVFVAFIPVVHALYLELLEKYNQRVYIIDGSILEEWPEFHKLSRDLRTINSHKIADLIRNNGTVKEVKVLEKTNLETILKHLENVEIIMPKEDVSEWVAQKYFSKKEVKFENVFLRWNKPVSSQELEVSPDREITNEKFHQEMIEKANQLSEKSANWWRQIGVLAIKDQKIIAEGYNRHVPTQQNIAMYGDLRMCFDAGERHELSNSIHGEASLIANCAKKGISLEGATLYVTVFPCPTCAKLIAEAGIKKVYYQKGYSLSDSEDILKAAGIDLILVV